MDQFILFGDSLTQQCFAPGRGVFGPQLTDAYIRRLDIVNRGFSGYNTDQALQILPQIMPSPEQAKVRFLAIFFGANDARLPNTPAGGPEQHVPMERYRKNLQTIVNHPCVKAHQNIRIILITPPPVDERQLMQEDAEKGMPEPITPRRTASVTSQYAIAARSIAYENGLPLVDIWQAMMQRGEEPQRLWGSLAHSTNEAVSECLHDGLHFTSKGYQVLYEQLMEVIKTNWPDQMPEQLPFVFPRWDDKQAWTG